MTCGPFAELIIFAFDFLRGLLELRDDLNVREHNQGTQLSRARERRSELEGASWSKMELTDELLAKF